MVVFLIVAGFFAFIAGAATWAVVRLQRIELAKSALELDQYKVDAAKDLEAARAESDAKIAVARAESAVAIKKAQADIATAVTETAKANERAATLEKEAASARAEQERLKLIVAWRTLSADVGNTMVRRLREGTALVKVAYVAGDPEVLGLAIQFSKVLEAANWKVVPEAMTFSSQLVFEIRVPGPENETVNLLRKALDDAHVPFITEAIPPADMAVVHGGTEQPQATLFIGSKRPPF